MSLYNLKKELFVSVDIEADGPCPITNSMLSLGAVPFTVDGGVIKNQSFSVNLQPLPTAIPDPDTTKWWERNQEAYQKATINALPAKDAMVKFYEWVEKLGAEFKKKPVFAAWPAGFDFTFVYVYFHYFGMKCPFGFQAFDAKTYGAALTKMAYRDVRKSKIPKRWYANSIKHNHTALDDALGQAYLFYNMLLENLS